jgi:hypothetical protein
VGIFGGEDKRLFVLACSGLKKLQVQIMSDICAGKVRWKISSDLLDPFGMCICLLIITQGKHSRTYGQCILDVFVCFVALNSVIELHDILWMSGVLAGTGTATKRALKCTASFQC